MIWLRGILIIVVGAVPATVLLWFALIPLVAAVAVFAEHPASASVTIVWFLLAAIGTIALWLAPFRKPGPRICSGLLAGVLAICPFVFLLAKDLVEGNSDAGGVLPLLTAGPAAVAAFLLLSFFRKPGSVLPSTAGR
jgi:hypothetical protein